MNPVKIIDKYYDKNSKAYHFLVKHGAAVRKKALLIARNVPQLRPDLKLIKEAAMLHDIGIFLTKEPKLGCKGNKPYVCHGYLGREIMEKEGWPNHALVCERHVGMGITVKDIEKRNLPLPKRAMVPVSVEEEIVCLADKFFSKTNEYLEKEKSLEQIRKSLNRFGTSKTKKFDQLLKKYKVR